MNCAFCHGATGGQVFCPSCGLSGTEARQAAESLTASLAASAPKNGLYTGTIAIASGLSRDRWSKALGALHRGLAKASVPATKDQAQVFAEIQAASASSPGGTAQQRVVSYLKSHPEKYVDYRNAPQPTPPAPKSPPAPLSLSEAQRAFTVNPTSPVAAWDLVEAKARVYSEKQGVTKAQAVKHVLETDRVLAKSYVESRDRR